MIASAGILDTCPLELWLPDYLRLSSRIEARWPREVLMGGASHCISNCRRFFHGPEAHITARQLLGDGIYELPAKALQCLQLLTGQGVIPHCCVHGRRCLQWWPSSCQMHDLQASRSDAFRSPAATRTHDDALSKSTIFLHALGACQFL